MISDGLNNDLSENARSDFQRSHEELSVAVSRGLLVLLVFKIDTRRGLCEAWEISRSAENQPKPPPGRGLTRALLGGAFERPLRFFEDSEKTAARSAAGFSPTLPPIFSATFVKNSTQCHMRSGHQVRSSDPTTK